MIKRFLMLLPIMYLLSSCVSLPPIYNESYKGDYQKVETLLKNGTSPDITISNGWTPVMIAAAEGHKDVVQLLVNSGANVNATNKFGRTAIMFASRYGFTDIVDILARAGAKIDILPFETDSKSPLMAASAAGFKETVQKLINLKADINLINENGNDALQFAVFNGHIDVVKVLLENRAMSNRKNRNGISPLFVAIYQNKTSIAKLLLSMGADPNATFILRPIPEMDNYLSKDDIKIVNSGIVEISALMCATQYGNIEFVKELIGIGADVNFKNSIGASALSYAKKFNNKDILDLLIKAGASE